MDKQTIGKLELMLQGLSCRISEEMDYFRALKGDFKSGAKRFPLSAEPSGNMLELRFEGRKDLVSPRDLPGLLAGYAERYEAIYMECSFRGETLVIEAGSGNVTMKTRQLEEDRAQLLLGHAETGTIPGREYLIKAGKADPLLKEIGIMAATGKIKNDMIRKYNQIDHFVELLDPMIRELAADRNELRIVDCACGKSYLSFVLNYYIKDVLKINCRFTGIDISEDVIEASRGIAARLGYRNMNFIRGDIRKLIYEEDGEEPVEPDLVVSLHACDTATDYALAYGIRSGARGIVAVPCCHSELLAQYRYDPFREILKHGVLKARMADVLTDGIRCMVLEAFGYKVSAVEYVSPLDTPKNLLIRANRVSGFSREKYRACQEFARELNADPTLLKEIAGLAG